MVRREARAVDHRVEVEPQVLGVIRDAVLNRLQRLHGLSSFVDSLSRVARSVVVLAVAGTKCLIPNCRLGRKRRWIPAIAGMTTLVTAQQLYNVPPPTARLILHTSSDWTPSTMRSPSS